MSGCRLGGSLSLEEPDEATECGTAMGSTVSTKPATTQMPLLKCRLAPHHN